MIIRLDFRYPPPPPGKRSIECSLENGASVRTKNMDSLTPLDVAQSAEFVGAIKQAASFTSRKTLCIIGNAGSGKSTLIAALQAKKSSFFGRIYNYFFRRVDDVQSTAGIESIHHCNQEYGEALFFDFAGQLEYHGPHQVFLESLLSNRGVSMTLLLVVKATQEEEAIRHQLHCWLTPVALMANAANPAQVIVIGSFFDQVKSKEEAAVKLATCVDATRKDLQEQLPLQIVGSCLLNCRQPQSEGMYQLCRYLEAMSVPEFRAAHTQYSLAWVLSQIRSCFKDQAIQLQRFAKWIQDLEKNLPQTMPPPEEVCQDLAAAGHVIYLPNKEAPPMSWLVLDLPGILRDLYGTLFSQNVVVHNEFGLLHNTQLKALFPDLDEKFVQQLLVCLEFCIPVDPSLLKVENLIQEENTSGWLFFPALISANPPQPRSEGVRQENLSAQCLCWQLKTSRKHYISARVLQTILLRLAAHFVVLQHNEDGVCHHSCNIWLNGIAWWTNCGIDVTIHITNNRVIKVVAAGGTKTSADKLFHYLSNVISDILITVKWLSPNLFAAAYIVHPPIMDALHEDVTTPTPMELFLVEGIRNTIATNNTYALSLKDPAGHPTRLPVSDLFGGWSPSLKDIKRILWTQPEPDQSQSPVESSSALSPASNYPPPALTAVLADPTDPPLDRPLASTVAANDPPLAPTVAANDPPLAHTVAANNPPLAPTVAANDQPLAPTVAANDQPLTPTVAANDQPLAPTVATNDCPLAPTVAANDCPLAPTAAANNPSLAPTAAANDPPPAPTVAANDPSLAPTAAANDPPLAPTVAANDPSLAPTVAANDPPLAPTVAANDPPLAPTIAANDCPLAPIVATNTPPLVPSASLVDTQPTPKPALQPPLSIPSGAQALLDTSAVPTLDDVNELIVTQVAAKWQNLAIKLGVKDFLIDAISEDHPKNCVAACQDMLKRWLREERHTGGEERMWSTLLTALGRADFGELERSLRKSTFTSKSFSVNYSIQC